MEKAKQKAIEIKDEILNNAEPFIDALKPEINNLLQTFLPGKITIEEAEILAMVIFDIIIHPNDYLLSAVKPDRDELDLPVLAMARMMQYKLDKNKHKECSVMNPDGKGRGWDDCSIDWLIMRLLKELVEMQEALLGGQPPIEIARECADICNFAMMIADNIGGLKEENEYLQSSPEPKEKRIGLSIAENGDRNFDAFYNQPEEPKEKPDGWISAKDRLPEDNIVVLDTNSDKIYYSSVKHHKYAGANTWYFITEDDDIVSIEAPTHWRPLPSLPTENKEPKKKEL